MPKFGESSMADRRARLFALEAESLDEPPQIEEAPPPTSSDLPPEIEAALLATLIRPLAAGENYRCGNAARENELAALLAKLDVGEALQLGRRIDLDHPGDSVASAFNKLSAERRHRLRAFLADDRRRSAVKRR